eukprot:scaffold216334_cov32-Tisochrysis_lutea.AAC.2
MTRAPISGNERTSEGNAGESPSMSSPQREALSPDIGPWRRIIRSPNVATQPTAADSVPLPGVRMTASESVALPNGRSVPQSFLTSLTVGERCSAFFQLKQGSFATCAASVQSTRPASRTVHWREKRIRGAVTAAV